MELEESTSVDVNNPGTFPTVCVELCISSLAVNTVIEVRPVLLINAWILSECKLLFKLN